MANLDPTKVYTYLGGRLLEVREYPVDPPCDPLSVDMVLQSIIKASNKEECDHGVSLYVHCPACSPEVHW